MKTISVNHRYDLAGFQYGVKYNSNDSSWNLIGLFLTPTDARTFYNALTPHEQSALEVVELKRSDDA